MSTAIAVDISRDLRRLTEQARDIVILADYLGYQITWLNARKHLIQMRSSFDNHVITLPTTNINANRLLTTGKQVIRHADPEKVRDRGDIEQVADRNRKAGKVPASFHLATGLPVPQPPRHKVVTEQQQEEPVPESPSGTTKFVPEIVSEKPWLARRSGTAGGGGAMYESPTVVERRWSDGAVDYACRAEGCDFTDPNARSVSAHFGAKHSDKRNPQPMAMRVSDYVPTDIERPARRLATEITAALDGIDGWTTMDAAELAQVVAHRVIEARPDHHVSLEPLTDEQIVRRIAMLMDRGQTLALHQQITEQGERIASLLTETERAQEAEAKAKAERERIESDVAALRSIIDSIGGKTEEES